MNERGKTLNISKKKEELRKKDLERILSDHGTQLRINRSIQAEGSFASYRVYSWRMLAGGDEEAVSDLCA